VQDLASVVFVLLVTFVALVGLVVDLDLAAVVVHPKTEDHAFQCTSGEILTEAINHSRVEYFTGAKLLPCFAGVYGQGLK
jgi:hypothetical protein